MTLRALLLQSTGLNLSGAAVERALRQRMQACDQHDSAAYLRALTPDELGRLVELVVVAESWLFRDVPAFAAMAEFVQRRLRDGRKPVRILSIPCASGEEPYSIAMTLRDAGMEAECEIDAVDLSAACIARAVQGVYGRNAFRNQDLGFRARHFHPIGNEQYQIADPIRAQVRFRQGNLLQLDSAAYARHYDVVFCRNLLIYFDQPTAAAAIAKLEAVLADDGLLFAGYAELPQFCQHGFTPFRYPQAFGLTKTPPAAGPAMRRPAARGVPPSPLLSAAHAADPGRPAPAAAAPSSVSSVSSVSLASSAPSSAPSVSSAPAAASGPLELARQLADRGQLKEAATHCQAHLARVPDSAEAYFLLGVLSEQSHHPQLAEDCWRRCLYLQPDHYDALCHLALLSEQRGDLGGAAHLKARAARIFRRQRPA